MSASYRQAQILRVVRSRQIHTQDELARELAALGIPATQVTLSRDIRKLGLAKTADGYVPLDSVAATPVVSQVGNVVYQLLQEIRVAQNMVVLKTPAGKANALAVELDRENWPEVVGTLAGDDTIFIVTPNNTAAAKLREKLMKLVE